MHNKLSRRQFLRRAGLGLAAGAAAAAGVGGQPVKADPPPFPFYLPVVLAPPADVVRVHADAATSWDYLTGWNGDYVSLATVTAMMERGLREVTGAATPAAAWAMLLPGYTPGKKIAVKVNLNNAVKDDADNIIDALPQVAMALLKTLCVDFGAAQQDVMIYDAVRPMPGRFYTPVHAAYPQVGLFDNGGGYAPQRATFNHVDSSLRVTFTQPNMKASRYLTDLLFQATYVINIPILKKHGGHPVTLAFKNHFGSTQVLGQIGGVVKDDLHPYISPNNLAYDPAKIPLVDINANPNIRYKTVLTIGDGLFGANAYNGMPVPWFNTFAGQAPNSLIFSRDVVAGDCVMCDLLRTEFDFAGFPPDSTYDYLVNAEQRGLGRYEKGDPWGAGYNKLKYKVVELI